VTESRLSRTERRRAETEARILRVAAHHFALHGVESVRLDHLAGLADVARGTLYNYFPAKDRLIAAIMAPVLERGCARLDAISKLPARRAVEDIVELYLALYAEFPDALRVAYQMQGGQLGSLEPKIEALHGRFLGAIVTVFDRAAARGILRAKDGRTAARAMASVAVPLLQTFADKPGGSELFRDSLRGLLLRDQGE